jgi:hypothetical protein
VNVCMRVASIVEQAVEEFIDTWVTQVETVCKQVTEAIEEWHTEFQNQCKEVSKHVCSWMPWPLSDLCGWVTETVCKVVEVAVKTVTTIVKTVCEVVTSLIRVVVRIVTSVFLVVLRWVCFWVDFIINWIKIIISWIIYWPEFLLCLAGLRIPKYMHVCVTVLAPRRGDPTWSDAQVTADMDAARKILLDAANVELVEHGRKVVRVDDEHLDADACDISQLFSADAVEFSGDSETVGTFRDLVGCGGLAHHVRSALLVDYVNVIFMRVITEGDRAGCHVPGTDYVLVARTTDDESGQPPGETLAHELGHAGDLWHQDDPKNLMTPGIAGNVELKGWQACLLRRSRFVTYMP